MWERRMEWPLNAAAVVFLMAYSWPILQPSLGATGRWWSEFAIWITWAFFALDYVGRLWGAADRRAFLRRHMFDLLVILVPLLRPLRLLRLLTALNALNRRASARLRGHVIVYVVGATSLLVLCAGLAILDVERARDGSSINTFGDALWWAVSTITTVGYGDAYPVTDQGRAIAVGLMLAGIALLGVVTASFASWLVERVSDIDESSNAATRAHVESLERKIDELANELRAIHHPARSPLDVSTERTVGTP